MLLEFVRRAQRWQFQAAVDAAIYALHNMVERCFNKLKNARRLAT
jgi:transposase